MARVQAAKRNAHATPKSSQNQYSAKQQKNKRDKEKKADLVSKKSKGKSPARPDTSKQHDSLREEILALGGDDEDYELLKDVNSDEEVLDVSSSKKDSALSKDLEKFMKGLDFSSVRDDDAEDGSDTNENAEEREEDEDESEEGSSPHPPPEVPQQKPERTGEKQSITMPKVGPNSKLLLEPTPYWFTLLPPLPPTKSTTSRPPSQQILSQKQSHGSSLHISELSAYETATSSNKLTSSSSDAAFLQKILTSGTLSDRLSALTLMAQSSPVHNTRALETLRGMASKKGKEESLKALRAIVDWWVGGGAPDRKLKYFIDQPLTHPGATDKHLLLWYFEDWLKKYFYSILQLLETLSLDALPYVRLQAISLIFTLLRDKPEQEQNLLRLLVNKLGDSERSVASRASYHLLQLLQTHPSMKAVVVREISSLILKPSRSSSAATSMKTASGATHLKFTDSAPKSTPKAKAKPDDKGEKKDLQQEHSRYYASIMLNQIMLSSTEGDRAVARQLISLYLELFKEILGSPEKLLHNNASDTGEGKEVDHTWNGTDKRKKMQEKTGKGKEIAEREGFAEVEDSDSRLVSAILTGVNRALPFAKLGLEDVEFSRHIDMLFLISHKSTFNISLQALRLIMQICHSLFSTPSTSTSTSSALSTSITDRYYRALYTSLQDTRLNTSSKHAMYLNMLLKSLKMDTKVERVGAFVRRFVQLLIGAGNGGVEFIAGGLYLLGELFKVQPALRDLLGKPRHIPNSDGESHEYDPKKRDPQYANADSSPIWELVPLLSHYHPTARLHASQLLSGVELTATADLSLNTLSHFLDRFVYKNPKKLKPKGPSAMQPAASNNAQDGTSIRIVKGAQNDDRVVNDESFWKKDAKDVPVDQLFFHKYFSQKNEKEHAKAEKVAKRKGGAGSGGESESEAASDSDGEEQEQDKKVPTVAKSPQASDKEDESEGEAEIWKAMQATNPDLHPELDDEDDLPSDDDSGSGSDSDGAGSDDDASSDAGEAEVDIASDGEESEDEEEVRKDEDEGDEDDKDALSLAEASDAEDLISLNDVELPEGLIAYHSSDAEDDSGEEWEGFDDDDDDMKKAKDKKRKHAEREREEKKNKRRKLRSLPTFATYEDYAKLIEGEPEDNI